MVEAKLEDLEASPLIAGVKVAEAVKQQRRRHQGWIGFFPKFMKALDVVSATLRGRQGHGLWSGRLGRWFPF